MPTERVLGEHQQDRRRVHEAIRPACLGRPDRRMEAGGPQPRSGIGSSVANPASTGPIFYRRAYYSRFLILSGGPDKEPGVARLYDPKDKVQANYRAMDDRSTFDIPEEVPSSRDASGGVGNSVNIFVGRSNPDYAGPKLVLESMEAAST